MPNFDIMSWVSLIIPPKGRVFVISCMPFSPRWLECFFLSREPNHGEANDKCIMDRISGLLVYSRQYGRSLIKILSTLKFILNTSSNVEFLVWMSNSKHESWMLKLYVVQSKLTLSSESWLTNLTLHGKQESRIPRHKAFFDSISRYWSFTHLVKRNIEKQLFLTAQLTAFEFYFRCHMLSFTSKWIKLCDQFDIASTTGYVFG